VSDDPAPRHATGPRTEAGKARASANALRHGLYARRHLLLPGEDAEAFAALRADLFAHYAPADPVRAHLVARLALLLWRLGRLAEAERLVLMEQRAEGERRFRGAEAILRTFTENDDLARLGEFERRLVRELLELSRWLEGERTPARRGRSPDSVEKARE